MGILRGIMSILKASDNIKPDEIESIEKTFKSSVVEKRETVCEIKESSTEITIFKDKLKSELYDIEEKIKIAEEQLELSIASKWDDLAKIALNKKNNLLEQKIKISREINELEEKIRLI